MKQNIIFDYSATYRLSKEETGFASEVPDELVLEYDLIYSRWKEIQSQLCELETEWISKNRIKK